MQMLFTLWQLEERRGRKLQTATREARHCYECCDVHDYCFFRHFLAIVVKHHKERERVSQPVLTAWEKSCEQEMKLKLIKSVKHSVTLTIAY